MKYYVAQIANGNKPRNKEEKWKSNVKLKKGKMRLKAKRGFSRQKVDCKANSGI